MQFPGRIIKVGERDRDVVKTVHDRLEALGYTEQMLSSLGFTGTFSDRNFDQPFKGIVKLFQSQHVDGAANPLDADGEIGPLTWTSLFGTEELVDAVPAGRLAAQAVEFARTQVGVREDPVGSNRGPEVDKYLASVGLKPGLFWCMAFVFYCFEQAAAQTGLRNTFPRTGGCLDAWNKSRSFRITRAAAVHDPSIVTPGSVFIIDHGGGLGHAGFVTSGKGGSLATIEGNSNDDGSSNGIGVFALHRRSVMDKDIKGFIKVAT